MKKRLLKEVSVVVEQRPQRADLKEDPTTVEIVKRMVGTSRSDTEAPCEHVYFPMQAFPTSLEELTCPSCESKPEHNKVCVNCGKILCITCTPITHAKAGRPVKFPGEPGSQEDEIFKQVGQTQKLLKGVESQYEATQMTEWLARLGLDTSNVMRSLGDAAEHSEEKLKGLHMTYWRTAYEAWEAAYLEHAQKKMLLDRSDDQAITRRNIIASLRAEALDEVIHQLYMDQIAKILLDGFTGFVLNNAVMENVKISIVDTKNLMKVKTPLLYQAMTMPKTLSMMMKTMLSIPLTMNPLRN